MKSQPPGFPVKDIAGAMLDSCTIFAAPATYCEYLIATLSTSSTASLAFPAAGNEVLFRLHVATMAHIKE